MGRLPYLSSVELIVDANGVSFSTTALNTLLDSRKASNEREAVLDLVDLDRYSLGTLQVTQFDALGKLRTWVEALPAGAALRTELAALNVYAGTFVGSRSGIDLTLGNAAANSYSAGDDDGQDTFSCVSDATVPLCQYNVRHLPPINQ